MIENGNNVVEFEFEVAELGCTEQLLIGTDLFSKLGFNMTGIPATWPGQQMAQEEDLLEKNEETLTKNHSDVDITDEERRIVAQEWQELI